MNAMVVLQESIAEQRSIAVPFLDLKGQYDVIRDEIGSALQDVLEQTAFAGGPFVEKFEEEFARFCQCRFAMGVGSGTEALWVALKSVDIGPGDEVITAANTFIATAEAISLTGAEPVFVDVTPETYTIEPQLLEGAITWKTRAIIPVHLYGQMADMDEIMAIARKYNLLVIEDASQSHGATYKGKLAGSIADAGCFSFYPGKNLGAYGEAGAVVTNDERIAERVRVFRQHGQTRKHCHELLGWNCRMDGFQGAVLSVKLKYLKNWNDARREAANRYSEGLEGIDRVVLPFERAFRKHVYHIYPIRVPNRDDLMRSLAARDIHCGVHYPVPVHLQYAYRYLGLPPGTYPVTEKCSKELLSLPMHERLTAEQIDYVCEMIDEFVKH